MNKQKLYNKAPLFVKFILLNIKGYINTKKRYSTNFKSYYTEYISLWRKPLIELRDFQKKQLQTLLLECYEYSDWYQNIFSNNSINKNLIQTKPFEVLSKLPILLKEERKENTEKILNNNPKRSIIMTDYTSGTSGSPTKNYTDLESIEKSFALWKRFHSTIGIKNNVKQVRFSGNQIINTKRAKSPFWLYNISEKQLLMSTYHLNDTNMINYIKKLNQFKPIFLDGYPSAFYNISKFINFNKLKFNFKPIAICTTSETLYDYQREEIEKAFQCKVFNQYASSEGSPFITECLLGNLHVNLDSGIFEFLNQNNKPAKPGEIAKMVVTSFRNLKTPLIRYDIGDNILLSKKNISCECGCNMPIIEKIIGREDDLLLSENGTLIGMMAYKVFKYASNIKRGQIIQKSQDDITINLEIEPNFNKNNKQFLITKIKQSLGNSMKVKINIVTEIPLGKNGKFITVKRKFKI
ncbi:MAG: hypothetical protein L3J23_09505 [Flavobacteriaceae bacterium]|nr:hypothetical protein [Flavobacteriaceae bacterium]